MSRAKILIVDNDRNVRKSLVRALQDDDYEISTAGSGAEGLELMRKKRFHLVISDYRMMKMDGVKFLMKVKKLSVDTCRIMLTGYADEGIAVAAINEGHVYKFFMKPWDDELLKIEVKKALEFYGLVQQRKKLHRELFRKNTILKDMNKHLEELVEERTQQLIHAEKMAALGQMAAQIGHEINNVLTILDMRMSLLEKNISDTAYVKSSVEKLSHAIDRLKIQAGNLLIIGKPAPPDFTALDLRTVVDTALENLRSAGVLKYYHIDTDYRGDMSSIYGDGSQIDHALTNILINAHHAMGTSGNLNITLAMSERADYSEVSVADSGKGIPRSILNKIFEPFFSTKPQGEGTGLGLSVVKKIIEEHKGYIHIDSRENAGTTVTLGFPALRRRP